MGLDIGLSQSHRFAESNDLKVNGLPGVGCYFLVVSLKFTITKIEAPTTLKNFRIRLETSEQVNGRIGWGELDDQRSIELHEHSNKINMTFLVQLTSAQINALEKYRAGGDIQINVWLFGHASQGQKKHDVCSYAAFTIPQQQWTEALQQMHYERTLLFEVRFPVGDKDDKKSLESLLSSAWTHFSKGHYSESVSYCRQAIEKVEKVRKDKVKAGAAIEKYKTNRQEMTLQQRILFLREAVKNVTQLGAHYDDDAEIGFREAKAVLGATISLISDASLDFT